MGRKMNIPPIPKPKPRKPVFPDPDERMSKIELRQELRKVLFALRASLPARKKGLADLIVTFSSRLLPQALVNLPYVSVDGKAKNRSKDECVAALISHTIQQGWAYQRLVNIDKLDNDTMTGEINKIKKITKVGLGNCKAIGDAKGYELEIR